MPFTLAHAAVVLPLKKLRPRWFSLTGLMAGAISPDLLYFLMLQTEFRGLSHSWSGLLLFCLPAGLAFSFAFHYFFKQPVIGNLPRPLEHRLSGLAEQRFRVRSLRAWVVLTASVLIGAISHFFWDSFTHNFGEVAQLFPVLNQSFTFLGITLSLCRFAQHSSTIIGIAVLGLALFKGRLIPPLTISRPTRTVRQKLGFWLVGGALATAFACFVVFFYDRLYDLHIADDHNHHSAMQSFGLAGWAGFFYYCCIQRLLISKRQTLVAVAARDEP